ncbi:MAG TPA: helix-turn-helix transcriptional regulator [Candidatus Binataceae bacterium]|nr:helix-turn-helix transcriptional regulator [Candidatus Binataceae bacterium]
MSERNLGPIIKEARTALRLTQRELAAEVGVKASHIAYIENDQRKPSLGLLKRLAETLGLEPRKMLFLAHPEAKYLTGDVRKPSTQSARSSWNRFSSNRILLRRHNVTRTELKVLKQVSLMENVADPRNYLFILNSIRLAGDRDAHAAW